MINKLRKLVLASLKKSERDKMSRFLKFWPPFKENDIPMSIFETDKEFNELYEKAQRNTQMESTDNAYRRQRHYTLFYLFKNALDKADYNKINIAEIGCWRGLSAFHISDTIVRSNKDVLFHIFDSFEGLSEFTANDDSLTINSENQEKMRRHFAYDVEKVKKNLSLYDFIKYYQGWVPTRFNEVAEVEFTFVHIDVDLYDPTYDCISFFYPRLRKNGIIVLDDYGATTFLGAQKAVDDYLRNVNKDEYFFLNLPSTQAFLIKL